MNFSASLCCAGGGPHSPPKPPSPHTPLILMFPSYCLGFPGDIWQVTLSTVPTLPGATTSPSPSPSPCSGFQWDLLPNPYTPTPYLLVPGRGPSELHVGCLHGHSPLGSKLRALTFVARCCCFHCGRLLTKAHSLFCGTVP